MRTPHVTAAAHFRNLMGLWDQVQEKEKAEALVSYWHYHRLMESIGERWKFSPQIAAGVFSALSPNNDYLGNLRDAVTVLRAVDAGKGPDDVKVSTYHPNKRKAFAIARLAKPDQQTRRAVFPDEIAAHFAAPKTHAFFWNVAEPDNPDHVTIDGHMYWSWMGRRGTVKSRTHGPESASVSAKLYVEIADAVKLLAGFYGVVPNQVQAVLWTVYRRIHNIQQSAQLELIASDALIASL